MNTHRVSRRQMAGVGILAALGVVWLRVKPPEATPLPTHAHESFKETIERLGARTKVAIQAVSLMDPEVFAQAPKSLNTPEEVIAVLQAIPEGYLHLLETGGVYTLPASYMVEQGDMAYARGTLTPWESDDTLVISWDEATQSISVPTDESLEAVLAHEMCHYLYGTHGLLYKKDSLFLASGEADETDWARLNRTHSDVPYILSDVYWMIDEWTRQYGLEMEPLHMPLASVYGLDAQEVRELHAAALRVREHELQQEWSREREGEFAERPNKQ